MEPLIFKPLLKQTLWGGEKIVKFKGLDNLDDCVGESWEVSGVIGRESIVANGDYQGMSLNEVLRKMQHELVGKENYRRFGDEFPLLVKFIDARRDLSIQVHPDDDVAIKKGMRNGKTEMWYVIDAEPSSKLYCGLKQKISSHQYWEMAGTEAICDVIREYQAIEGDCFFLPGGCIHSIGKGCFLAEIQQASDITYRIYDYKRKDENNVYRELHTKEAGECINFSFADNAHVDYTRVMNQGVSLVNCKYFKTKVYDIDTPIILDYSSIDSFVILIGIKGEGVILDNEGNKTVLFAGNTLLIPATTKNLKISGEIKFLETYI